MYHPYFRGKQYELIAIRESAGVLATANFTPIIEPVREQTAGLKKALDSLREADGSAIVIANPQIGDLTESGENIVSFIKDEYKAGGPIRFGLVVTDGQTLDQIKSEFDDFGEFPTDLIHFGFSDPKSLSDYAIEKSVSVHAFPEGYSGKLYQRNFKKKGSRILLRDGFEQRRNRDHPDSAEFFSDLHVTFDEEGMDGFGDYLIVGNEYREGGGPAYTIAIHLTFIDSQKDDAMFIQHFKSDRQDTPKDPAGKFAEALAKLISHLNEGSSQFYETSAIQEFRQLHDRGHYPGLGYVKKLAMKHHIETLATYF